MKESFLQIKSLIKLQLASVTLVHARIMVVKAVLPDRWVRKLTNSCIQVKKIISVLLWVGVFVTQIAHASDLTGSDDPALLAAIEVWLEDNDKDSLPVIATLAGEGNIAARLLLARIENADIAPSDYVNNLSRKERVDLFRSTSGKGVFRPSWLKSESEAGNEMASALLKSSGLELNIKAIRKLYEIGEPEATYDLITQVAANGSQIDKEELAEFLPLTSELAPYLRALQTPAAGFTTGFTALQQILVGGEVMQPEEILSGPELDTETAATFVALGYEPGVHTIDFNPTNYYYDDLVNWIESAPATAPIAILCRQYCNNGNIESCAVTAFGLVGGYYKAIRFDSPFETLIKQSRYVSSDRAAGMLLRRISFIETSGGYPLITDDELRDKSICLAQAVAGVRSSRN